MLQIFHINTVTILISVRLIRSLGEEKLASRLFYLICICSINKELNISKYVLIGNDRGLSEICLIVGMGVITQDHFFVASYCDIVRGKLN